MKKTSLLITIIFSVLLFSGCADDGNSDNGGEDTPPTTVTFESAVQTGGTSGTADSTGLTLTFSVDPTTLAASNITVTGATRGELTGSGTTRSIAISNITVGNEETVSVSIISPSGFTISGSTQTAMVYKDTTIPPTAVIFESVVQTGGSTGTVESTGLTLTFDTEPTTLTVDNITVTGARKISLSDTGTTRTLIIADINVANEATLSVSITSPPGYSIAGSPQTATVYRIIEANMTIGMNYRGGKLAYILQSGDTGYDANVPHGLIAAPVHQSTGVQWGGRGAFMTGTGIEIGSGKSNTDAIVNFFNNIYLSADPSITYYTYNWTALTSGTVDFTDGINTYSMEYQNNGTVAAKLCVDYEVVVSGVIYDDWYLPSRYELDKLFENQSQIGGYPNPNYNNYWSSTETGGTNARYRYFGSTTQGSTPKNMIYRVRAVRAF